MAATVFLFVNTSKIYQFKAKEPERKPYPFFQDIFQNNIFDSNFLLIIKLLILVLLSIKINI